MQLPGRLRHEPRQAGCEWNNPTLLEHGVKSALTRGLLYNMVEVVNQTRKTAPWMK